MGREKRYKFSDEVNEKLQNFKEYLKGRKYSDGTIAGYKTKAGIFLQWLEQKSEKVEEVNYHIIKDFVLELREEYSVNQINLILISIKHYYKSLDLGINPASSIQQRGADRSLRHYFITYEELEQAYELYEVSKDRDFRNKVMLGMMIYQGVMIGELKRIREEHIELRSGKVTIIGHRKSKTRVLQLSSVQLLDLQEYLLIIRSNMLHSFEEQRPGRRPKNINPDIKEKLFFSESGSVEIKNSLKHLFRKVKKSNPQISSVKVIRSTVIAEWLKTIDVRKVQYMCGHKYVSSTERYKAYNLGELKESLKKYHPLK